MAYTNSKLHVVAVGGRQINADWDETNPLSPAYIRNKPNITGGLHYEVVEELPTEDIDPNCIYMVPREGDTEAGNYYDEYMYIEGDWELIGSTATQNIQADFDETDPSNPAYINNKPDTLDFIVPFTEVSDVISTTVSKADIIAAMNAGKTVRATLNGQFYELVAYTASPEKMSFSTVIEDTTVSIIGKIVNDNWTWGSYETELNVQANWNEADASNPSYIQNKPTIPIVNDATITIQQNGTTVGTFTTNDADDTTINLTGGDNNWYGTYEEYLVLKAQGQLEADRNYYIEGDPISGLAKVATTGNYNDLNNRPSIPSVGNGTVTLKKSDGSTLGSFSTNQSNNTDITIATSDNWFGTQQEFDALQTYDEEKNYFIQGDLATVATTGDYDDLSNKPTIPAAPVQSDWNESDNTSLAYIANKPTNMVFGNAQGTPTSFTIRTISAADYANLPSYDSNTVYLVY